jgi:Glutathione-dependent formaldehyde-activating enzyme
MPELPVPVHIRGSPASYPHKETTALPLPTDEPPRYSEARFDVPWPYKEYAQDGQVRGFCSHCGSRLLSRGGCVGEMVVIEAGTLDEPSIVFDEGGWTVLFGC